MGQKPDRESLEFAVLLFLSACPFVYGAFRSFTAWLAG